MQATVLSALGEPNRLRIVELLRTGPHAVGEIADVLELRQPQVSKHLRALGEHGIVAAEPVARRRIYRLRNEPFAEMALWLSSFEQLWETRLDSLGQYLEQPHVDPAANPTTSSSTNSPTNPIIDKDRRS